MTTPNALGLGVSVQFGSSTQINTATILQISLTPTNPLPVGAVIQMTFPSQLILSLIQVTAVTGVIGVRSGSLAFTLSGQSISITNGFPTYFQNTIIILTISTVNTPASTKPTDPITAETSTNTGNLIDQTSLGTSFSATPGTITNVSISPNNAKINAATYYKFVFTLTDPAPSVGGIVITAPSQVTVVSQPYAPCFLVEQGLQNGSMCSSDLQNHIYVSNCFSTNFFGQVILDLNGLINPATIQSTSNFSIRSYADSGFLYVIDENLSAGWVTAVPDSLVSVQVTPQSLIVGALTTYKFSITTRNPILKGGYVTITFPSEVYRNDPNTPCVSPVGFESTFQCDANSAEITVSSGFVNSNFAPGTLSFAVSQIRNPTTTKQSGTFIVGTYTATGLIIDSLSIGIYVTMTTPNQLLSASVSSGNNVVSAISSLTFMVQPNNPMPNNGVVLITAPVEVTFPNPPTCVLSGTVTVTVSCSIVNGVLNAQVTFGAVSVSTMFGFTVNSVQNPLSTKSTSSFQLLTTSSTYLIDTMTTGVTFSVTQPNSISGVVQQAKTGISEVTTYTFTLNLKNPVPANGYVTVVLPNQVTITSNLSCLYLNAIVQCSNIGGNSIMVSIFPTLFNPAQVMFSIAGLQNFNQVGTSAAFVMVTKTVDNYLIDQSGDQTVTFTCYSPCSTCDTIPTQCTACVSASALPYLYNKTCNAACQPGFVDLGSKTCVSCDASCSTCFGATTSCTSCYPNGSAPYLSASTCLSACPPNTMANTSLVCITCDASCKTCSGVATVCTSCVSPKLLYNSQCVDSCPASALLVSGTGCLDCNSNCATCSGTVSQCTSCSVGMLLYKGTCVTTCAAEVTIVTGLQCFDCDPDCKTCAGSVTTCVSCYSGNLLYNNQCVAQCPVAYTPINNVCNACITGCASCATTIADCTSCVTGLLLHNSSCVSQCPVGTSIQSGNSCLDCNSNCATCTGTTVNCASCPAGKLLYQGTCVTTCLPNVTVIIGSQCFNCDPSCKSCSGSVTQCVSCYPGFSLDNNKCVSQCGSSATSINQVCQPCDQSCLTCGQATNACTSCSSGMFLYQSTCVQKCPVGQSIATGTKCVACASSCKTCVKTADTCDTCPSNSYLLSGQCVTSCPSKYLPVNGSCNPCDSSCGDCQNSTSTCVSCPPGRYLDSSSCLTTCPASRPIQSGQECKACDTPCLTCTDTTGTCLTCISSLLLFNSTCVQVCPNGYYQSGVQCIFTNATECAPGCVPALLQNNECDQACNTKSCNYDNGSCSAAPTQLNGTNVNTTFALYDGTLLYAQHPFPASGIGAGSGVLLAVSKVFIRATALTTTVVSVWGVCETAAWVMLSYYVYTAEDTHGTERMLMQTEDAEVMSLFALLVATYVLHTGINIAFAFYYTRYTCKQDSSHMIWRNEHCIASFILIFLSTILSFKVIRLMYSGLFGFKICLTTFERRRAFFRPLLILTILSLAFTTIPFLCLSVYAMVVFSSGNLVFIVALDCLTITIMSLFATVADVVMMTHVVAVDASTLNLTSVTIPQHTTVDTSIINCTDNPKIFPAAGSPHSARSNEPFDKNMFIQEYLSGTEAMPPRCDKEVSFEFVKPEETEEDDADHLRCQSTYSVLEPEGERFATPNRPETVETENQEVTDRFSAESVKPTQSAVLPKNRPETVDTDAQEAFDCFEIEPVLGTESAPPPSAAQSLDPLIQAQLAITSHPPESTGDDELFANEDIENPDQEDSELEGLRNQMQALGTNSSIGSQSIEEVDEPQLLDTIPEESALELDSAEIDEFDSDCIRVPLKPSGIKVLVKKSFDGAIPVDEKGEDLPDAQPLSLSQCPDTKIEVDRNDVRFGTLKKSNSESRIRVRRSFSGAKVVDIEMMVEGEKRWLVGRTAAKESDFDFSSAKTDPQDPDSLIVKHKLSGHKVRIQKPQSLPSQTPSFQERKNPPLPREFMGGRIMEVLPTPETGSLMLYQLPIFSVPRTPQSKKSALFRTQRSSTQGKELWALSATTLSPLNVEGRNRYVKSSVAKARKTRRSRSSSRSSNSIISKEESSEKMQRVYGLENAGLTEDSGVIQVRPRKRSKLVKRRASTQHFQRQKSLKGLEEIYLQRLEMPGRPSTTRRTDMRMPVFNPFFNSEEVDENSLSRPANSPEAQFLSTHRNPEELGLEFLRGGNK